ncbi:hypothetical protein DFW101_3286 [Solidesulfovibrio carbinoliphilus subsp. oakridgensis]|uniref:Uncharacterized protein n=1 Tax=Solidesulfovibrio carbinoliphilus subsp. oakridgensis TaxID=694327 RepID=G7QAQ4_9BACT|nr:hypothetical protein [Solidesulfovibrio carbinoliphilus]EHJ49285.1 hypothetical protein DFW101_3286 [Solidesulfovibrio carbinoliphilus subsp. oakridgensis]
MQKIPLNLARPGMVLAKPVARSDGIAVAAAGSELSENLLARFEAMGVSHLVVEGEPVALDGPAGSSSFDKRLERLEYLFRRFPDDKWMGQIRRLLDHYFRMKAASSAAMAEAAQAARAAATAEAAKPQDVAGSAAAGKDA